MLETAREKGISLAEILSSKFCIPDEDIEKFWILWEMRQSSFIYYELNHNVSSEFNSSTRAAWRFSLHSSTLHCEINCEINNNSTSLFLFSKTLYDFLINKTTTHDLTRRRLGSCYFVTRYSLSLSLRIKRFIETFRIHAPPPAKYLESGN